MSDRTPDPLRPRRPGGMGRGALFALMAHIVLLLALAFGVSWRSSEPSGVSAELWAAVPEQAAPAAVVPPTPPPPAPEPPRPQPKPEPVAPPKPDPREAEIAIEKARVEKQRQEREEREKAEAAKKRQQQEAEAKARAEKAAQAEKAKAEKAEKAEAERVEAQRKANLERILGQAGATGGPNATGSAQRDAGPSATYAGRIVARVKPNIVLTDSVPSTLRAEVEVRAAPDGKIVGRRLVKSSGNTTWDDAVLRAIDRTEILPRDVDGRVPSPMVLVFTPA